MKYILVEAQLKPIFQDDVRVGDKTAYRVIGFLHSKEKGSFTAEVQVLELVHKHTIDYAKKDFDDYDKAINWLNNYRASVKQRDKV